MIAMRYRIFIPLLSLAVLAACETTIDPATGQTQTTWTLPLTQANAEAPSSNGSNACCTPDGRPPGVQPVSLSRDNDP